MEKKQGTHKKGWGAGCYKATTPLHATGDLDRQTDSEKARWFLRGFEGITASGVEWSGGVGAAHEPSTGTDDGDAHAHHRIAAAEAKKLRGGLSFSPCLRVPLVSRMRYFFSIVMMLASGVLLLPGGDTGGSPVLASAHRDRARRCRWRCGMMLFYGLRK